METDNATQSAPNIAGPRKHRSSVGSSSSSGSSPDRGVDDDGDSIMLHQNDSQSSLGVSLEEMELDAMLAYEEQWKHAPITRLPAELLISVFSKLTEPRLLLPCMLVNKGWARNCVDLLWHRPLTSDWRRLLSVIGTARKRDGYFAYHDSIKRLNLGNLKDAVSDGVVWPLKVCNRIERLTLPGCSKLTDLSVAAIIDGNRNLLAVDISDLELITDQSLLCVAASCFKLQGLNISNCRRITDHSLVAVANGCRRVKRLKFNDCSQITDVSILAFADNCHDILEIDLHGCALVTDISATALLMQGRQLRELRLAECSLITDEAFLQMPTDQKFEALRILDLTNCHELQDAGLNKIVQAAPRLRNLVLAKCRNITDRGVLAITKLGKNLHFLHLGHCSNITDYGVSYLVKHCNRIRYIDFSCCVNLTDESVSLLALLPKLKRIGLVKCANITDRSIRALARPKTTSGPNAWVYVNTLERLHLSYCVNLTKRGVREMLINCPQLTHLSLTGIPPFLRDELLQFCREAPAEFNEHQRDVFCVFSGHGVNELREFLRSSYEEPSTSEVNHDDVGRNANVVGVPQTIDPIGPRPAIPLAHPFNWPAPQLPPAGMWSAIAPPPPPVPLINRPLLPPAPHAGPDTPVHQAPVNSFRMPIWPQLHLRQDGTNPEAYTHIDPRLLDRREDEPEQAPSLPRSPESATIDESGTRNAGEDADSDEAMDEDTMPHDVE